MQMFYLVRHAHAKWRPDENRPLSSAGLRDAQKVADILAGRPITTVFSSPYLRARQTVEPLAVKLGLRVCSDERFRERELGRWRAPSFEEAVRRTWIDMDFAYPGGETNRQAQTRALQALHELAESGIPGHILVGTHGNLLALLLAHYDYQVGYEFWRAMSMPDIYQMEPDAGDDVGFLRLWDSG